MSKAVSPAVRLTTAQVSAVLDYAAKVVYDKDLWAKVEQATERMRRSVEERMRQLDYSDPSKDHWDSTTKVRFAGFIADYGVSQYRIDKVRLPSILTEVDKGPYYMAPLLGPYDPSLYVLDKGTVGKPRKVLVKDRVEHLCVLFNPPITLLDCGELWVPIRDSMERCLYLSGINNVRRVLRGHAMYDVLTAYKAMSEFVADKQATVTALERVLRARGGVTATELHRIFPAAAEWLADQDALPPKPLRPSEIGRDDDPDADALWRLAELTSEKVAPYPAPTPPTLPAAREEDDEDDL